MAVVWVTPRIAGGDQQMPIPPGGFSRAEFRAAHGYSEQMFKSLKARGLAPKETLLPTRAPKRVAGTKTLR